MTLLIMKKIKRKYAKHLYSRQFEKIIQVKLIKQNRISSIPLLIQSKILPFAKVDKFTLKWSWWLSFQRKWKTLIFVALIEQHVVL